LKQHGYQSAKSGASSTASPVISDWRLTIWFFVFSKSRCEANEICFRTRIKYGSGTARSNASSHADIRPGKQDFCPSLGTTWNRH
jgi:hypothetical protein